MPTWTQLTISTTPAGLDLLPAYLDDIGISTFAIHDPRDFQDLLSHNTAHWDYLDDSLAPPTPSLTVYLPQNSQGSQTLSALSALLARLKASDPSHSLGSLTLSSDSIREEDWANNWKQFFHPFPVGNRLAVVPSWEPVPDTMRTRTILTIDPGSSFGTGQHHTTRLCLEALEDTLTPGDALLDLGCGSGILFLSALLLGASRAVGVDISENAVRIAADNAAVNHLSPDRFSLFQGDITADSALREKIGAGFDLITANIVADVLIAMAPLFPVFLKRTGTLIVSGIITEREQEVAQSIENAGFTPKNRRESGGWLSLTYKI